jgi:hypothetical protein
MLSIVISHGGGHAAGGAVAADASVCIGLSMAWSVRGVAVNRLSTTFQFRITS